MIFPLVAVNDIDSITVWPVETGTGLKLKWVSPAAVAAVVAATRRDRNRSRNPTPGCAAAQQVVSQRLYEAIAMVASKDLPAQLACRVLRQQLTSLPVIAGRSRSCGYLDVPDRG